MFTISFIKHNVLLHIIVSFLYGLLFLIQLTILGEIFYQTSTSYYSVEERTYTFTFEETDLISKDDLFRSLSVYDEVRFSVSLDDYNVVAYQLTDYLKNNKDMRDYISLNDSEVLLSSDALMRSILGEDDTIAIGDNCYVFKDFLNYDNQLSFAVYCTLDEFCSNYSSNVKVTVINEDKLTDSELYGLKTVLNQNLGVFEYISPMTNVEMYAVSNPILIFVIFILIIISFSFGRLGFALIRKRDLEYRVLRLCGLSNNEIALGKVLHFFIVMFCSIIMGLIMFWTLRSLFSNIILYSRDSILFYLLNVLVFVFVSFCPISISLVRGSKGYEN